MKNRIRSLCLAFSAVAAVLAASDSDAIPAFARQTNRACSGCHFQNYPNLNEVGRAFKAGGYTEMGKDVGRIEREDMSLPSTLMGSIFTKIRYQKTNGEDQPGTRTTNSGELQFPDEFSLLFGGRVSRNIGFFLEGQLANPSEPLLATFKIPFMFDVGPGKVGVIPFTTDSLGVAASFELLNTGAVHNQKAFEHAHQSTAQDYVVGEYQAEGFAFVAHTPMFFANFAKWSPNHVAGGKGKSGNGSPSANYLRAALTPGLGDWDLGFGGQLWNGSARCDNTECAGAGVGPMVDIKMRAWAIDGQAQGKVGNFPLGVYVTHAKAKASQPGENPNFFNDTTNDKSASAIAAQLGVLPNKVTLMLAYRAGRTTHPVTGEAAKDNAWTLGGTYQFAQNVQFQLQHSNSRGSLYDAPRPAGDTGNRLTTLMMSAAF